MITVSGRCGVLPEEEEACRDGKDGSGGLKKFDKSQLHE